jgi:hypothetical protein
MLKRVLLSTCTVFFAAIFTHAYAQSTYKKMAEEIIVNLPWKSTRGTLLLQLKMTSDKTIRVTATPENSFSAAKTKALTTNPIL